MLDSQKDESPENQTGRDAKEQASADLNPECWVDWYGDYLFRYAYLRLREAATAQDLVQETFLAGFKARASFSGRSSQRSWLLGILKNKIRDYFRKAARQTSHADMESLQELEAQAFSTQGWQRGKWNPEYGPQDWHSPETSLDRDEFWQAFDLCLSHLPKKIARVFLMREVEGISTEEICRDTEITPGNLWVMLHRARLGLRQCLENKWFNPR